MSFPGLGDKPHLIRMAGRWVCVGLPVDYRGPSVGYGSTVGSAFANMGRDHDAVLRGEYYPWGIDECQPTA